MDLDLILQMVMDLNGLEGEHENLDHIPPIKCLMQRIVDFRRKTV